MKRMSISKLETVCFRFVTVSECLLGKNNSINFENAYWEKIIWAHTNQEFMDGFKCFRLSNVYWDRKITTNLFRSISSKICLEIKNVQTFNIKKHNTQLRLIMVTNVFKHLKCLLG